MLKVPKTGLAVALAVLFLAGCSSLRDPEAPFIPEPMLRPVRDAQAGTQNILEAQGAQSRQTAFYETPQMPAPKRTASGKPPPPPAAVEGDTTVATITLDNMPLPQFVNAIFGAVLKRNVSMDAQVAQRTDMITFRTGKPQSTAQIFAAAQALLRSYGIAVQDYNGTVRVVLENSQAGVLPEIRRGRALPDVPASLRPVFYLVELEHTNVAQVSSWLKSLFQGRLNAQDDNARNAILLSGQSDTVSAAMEVIQLLDQPLMRGRSSVRIAPVFWSAEDMSKRLMEILAAEGYAVAPTPASPSPIVLLPIPAVNSIVVFAANEQVLAHVANWARELDQSPQGRGGNFITYHVRNTDAEELAKTLREVMGQGAAAAAPATGGQAGGAGGVKAGGGRVVVHPAANSLIIQTSPSELHQWYSLLQELDRPARSALIMATVAEVRLTDVKNFGFNWLIEQLKMGTLDAIPGFNAAGDKSGFRIGMTSSRQGAQGLLTALANTNKVKILSNPSMMARNGQEALMQVGQEVPIITSQISNSNTGNNSEGGQGIQQMVQYRSTGVTLKVKPVIHAGGRIDLDISQEVSVATETTFGVTTTPTIITRKVASKLSVSDGNTILMGGLIDETDTKDHGGIPYLKDIPVAGNLFTTSNRNNVERKELVILLTAYVVEDDFDAQVVTETFRKQFPWAVPVGRVALGDADEVGNEAQVRAKGAVPIAPALTSPDASSVSKPYVFPAAQGGVAGDERQENPASVAPKQQYLEMEGKSEGGFAQQPLPPVVNSGNVPLGEGNDRLRPVTDEALKQELLKALQQK